MYKYEIIDQLYQKMKSLSFSHMGSKITSNGTLLYEFSPETGENAFLHTIYPPLNDEEIALLSESIKIKIPSHLVQFFKECNGFHYFFDTLSIDGLRRTMNRTGDAIYQPYDLKTINVDERIADAPNDAIFFGGYDWDGSLVYTLLEEESVFLCGRESAKPIAQWPCIKSFINSETNRIASLFDENGIEKLNDSYLAERAQNTFDDIDIFVKNSKL